MRKILLYITALLFSVGLVAQPISLNSTNPHYFTYRGEPTVIVTSGEHYGAVLNTDFDYETYLATLAADGLNGTRLCAGANVEWDGWFDIDENTWAPAVGSYIGPWARATSGTYYNGGYAFDLTDWDEDYFTRLKLFVQEAASLDIIVELFFFSYIYYDNDVGDLLWSYNPMNTINNINGIGNVGYNDVFTTTDATMLGLQKDLVEKIVTELNQYDNIIWEIMNEPYMAQPNPVASAWEDTIIKVITETEALLSKQHLISQNTGNFSHTISSPNAATDLFNLHYAYAGTAYTVNDGVNKALGNNETGFTQSDAQYRQECYIAMTSGAAYFNVLDYSFTVGDEDGTTLPTGNPSGGGPTLRTQIAYAKDFIESFDYINMSPDITYINSVNAGVTYTSIMEEGEQYAIFLDGVTSFIQLSLPAGAYTITWIDTKTGVETSNILQHSVTGFTTMYPPTYTEDIALSIIKYVAEYVPSTPKSVRAGGMLLKHNSDAVSYLEIGTDTIVIPPAPTQKIVFSDTITWTYDPYTYGGYGFYWWHRPDENGITNYGEMPIANWEVPNDYYEGNFSISAEVISQPTSEPFYIQFGIWQDYGVSAYPETVADRKYLSGGTGSSGEWELGSPSTWWNKEPTDSVDFARADDFFRIGVVLWNPDPLCIPKGVAWGTDGCPENAYKYFPLEIAINVYASSDSTTIPDAPDAPSDVVFTSVTTGSMRVGWTDNSSDEDNFILEQALSSSGPFTEIATPNNNYYDNIGLTSGTRYYYRVAATNEVGTSSWATGNGFTSSLSWEDSIDYEIHYLEDFEDFPVTNVSTATSPVGVPLTDLQLYLYGFRDKQSDGGANGDPNLATTMDIMDIEGSRASVHWYQEGMCCTAAASDDNSNGTNDNLGTGVHIECDMDNSPGNTLLIGWNEFDPDSFIISDGMKNPGLRNGFGSEYTAMLRTMTLTSQTESDLAFYTRAYYDGFSLPTKGATNTKSLSPEEWNTKGRWVHHALLIHLGTTGHYDGYMEAFIDGEMPDPTVWAPARISSVPFINTGDNTTLQIFSIETFMGGGLPSYNSELTQFRIIDDFFAVSFDTDSDYGYPHSPGDKIYLPTIANFPKYTQPTPPPPDPDDDIWKILLIGNSICEGTYDELDDSADISLSIIAEPGATIDDQVDSLISFAAAYPDVMDSLDWVAIAPLGVNDIAAGEPYGTMVSKYDNLLSEINDVIPATCQILMYTMTPIKGNYYTWGTTEPDILKYTNENYIASGPTHTDVISTGLWDVLTDGNDSIHLYYNQKCTVSPTCPNGRDYTHPNWLGEERMREQLLIDIGYLSDFDGTIFKEVTFAELIPDQTTDARARTFMGSGDIVRWEADSAYSDSTVIRINDKGNTDTVWQVKLVMPAYDGATGKGASWLGEMELNGVDNTDDTLTQYNFTYYIKLGSDWDWDNSTGGKLPGVMGMDADGDYGPGGNVFLCGCVPYNSYEYCTDDGFTARGGFDWYGDDIGFYSYNHQMDASLKCDTATYGYSWNTARRAGSEAAGLDWELDKWYKITQRVSIGTAGSANGYMQMARNDTIMFSVNNIKIINDSRIKADAWYLAAFSGGQPNTSYKGMHVWFDDLILWQEDKRDAYAVGAVMTNVPDAKTPNTD